MNEFSIDGKKPVFFIALKVAKIIKEELKNCSKYHPITIEVNLIEDESILIPEINKNELKRKK